MLSRFDTIPERDRQTDRQSFYVNCSIVVLTSDQCPINPSGGPMPTRNGGPSNPLHSPSLPFPFPLLPLSPPAP